MAEKRSNPDQFQLRLPPGLRGRLKEAADKNNRSMNAEIVARLEEYPRLFGLQPLLAFADHEREALKKRVAALEESNAYLTGLISTAAKQEMEDADRVSIASILEGMHDELEQLSRERGDEKAETEALLKQQSELIDHLRSTQKMTEQVLLTFRDAFLDAASGDDAAFQRLVGQFAKHRGHE